MIRLAEEAVIALHDIATAIEDLTAAIKERRV
jgi:hypothetical protein